MKKFISIIAGLLFITLMTALPAEAKNIIKIGGDVTVGKDQKVTSVTAIGGQVTINGLVENNVIAVGKSIVLTNYAVVRGDVVCVGGVIVKGNGAQVFGDIMEINSANISNAFSSALRGELEGWSLIFNIISLCFFGVIFIIALLVAIFMPRPLMAVADEIKTSKGKSFFWGLLAALLMVPFFMLLVVSIIGITLIPIAFTVFLLAFIIGYIAAGNLIGNFIITRVFRRKKKSLIGETILGLIVLWLIAWIPYIGLTVKILALTFGMGGVLLALFHFSRSRHQEAPPPAQEQPAGPETGHPDIPASV